MSLVIKIFHLLDSSGEIRSRLLELGAVIVRNNFVYQSLLAGQKSHGEFGRFLQIKLIHFSQFVVTFLPEQSKDDISLKLFHKHP